MRVLFTGYAPVHFLCFQPLYERLIEMSALSVGLSGGTRTKSPFTVCLLYTSPSPRDS